MSAVCQCGNRTWGREKLPCRFFLCCEELWSFEQTLHTHASTGKSSLLSMSTHCGNISALSAPTDLLYVPASCPPRHPGSGKESQGCCQERRFLRLQAHMCHKCRLCHRQHWRRVIQMRMHKCVYCAGVVCCVVCVCVSVLRVWFVSLCVLVCVRVFMCVCEYVCMCVCVYM